MLLSVEDEDFPDAIAVARHCHDLGISLFATKDTANALMDILGSRFSLQNTELVDINHMRR